MATITAARSPLFWRQQPGGLPSIVDVSRVSGNVFYVDGNAAGAGDTTGHGQHPDSPFATLDYAIGQCTANQGDTIFILPGHAENVASAAAINVDVAGVTIIGIGRGNARPRFTGITLATATIQISAANIWLENLVFVAAFTNGITEFVDVKTLSHDLTFKNCEWREDLNTQEFLKCVTIEATISRVTFDGCRFKSILAGDSLSAIFTEGACTDLKIVNCWANGDWLNAVFDLDATAILTPEIGNCMIRNADPTNGFAITIDATTVGSFWNLRLLTQKANVVPIAVVTASFFADVIGTDVAATSGLVLPAAATAWS